MSEQKKINRELNSISRYMGLITSKYVIFVLLLITMFPMNIVPGYIFLAGLIFPVAFKFISEENSSKKDVTDFTLHPTAKKYKFSYLKYKAEAFNFLLITLLLIVWQLVLHNTNVFSYPVNIIPSFMLIIYILSRFLGSLFFKIKLHHNFMNMNL